MPVLFVYLRVCTSNNSDKTDKLMLTITIAMYCIQTHIVIMLRAIYTGNDRMLFVCLRDCLFVCWLVCLFVSLFILFCLLVYSYIRSYIHSFILCDCLSVCLSTELSLHIIFTVRLHVMQRTVLLSEFCLSVCPSVRQMRVL